MLKPNMDTSVFYNTLGLSDFWKALSSEEKRAIYDYYKHEVLGSKDILNDMPSQNSDALYWLGNIVESFDYKKDYGLCRKTISYVESNSITSRYFDVLHFYYLHCLKFYYKPKNEAMCDIEKAKKYCCLDIDLVLNNESKFRAMTGTGVMPGLPSFKQLTIILEKEGDYAEAMRICKIAISLGVDDDTKGGYPNRIKRLETKMPKTS